jgi:hypothetical protein
MSPSLKTGHREARQTQIRARRSRLARWFVETHSDSTPVEASSGRPVAHRWHWRCVDPPVTNASPDSYGVRRCVLRLDRSYPAADANDSRRLSYGRGGPEAFASATSLRSAGALAADHASDYRRRACAREATRRAQSASASVPSPDTTPARAPAYPPRRVDRSKVDGRAGAAAWAVHIEPWRAGEERSPDRRRPQHIPAGG